MVKKLLAFILIISSVGMLSGCAQKEFESILPPEVERPQADEYKTAVVTMGTISENKTLRGNKRGNSLYLNSSSGLDKEFKLYERGTVTYSYRNQTYTANGVIVGIPSTTGNEFVISHDMILGLEDNVPGTFSVVISEIKDCILVPKRALLLLGNGNAIVLMLDGNGVLVDREITVGATDGENYQVLSGLEVGESVVLR